MKPDGVAVETAEPAEVAAASEPSSMQENVVEEVPSHLGAAANSAPHEAPKTNGKPGTVDPKAKTKKSGNRPPPAASTGLSGSRPGTNSHRPVREVKPASPLAKKTATTTTTASKTTAGVVPKKHAGVAAVSSTGKNPTRAPAGAARPSAPTVPNGAKPANVNGTMGKKTAANSANGAKPKTAAAAGRTLTSTAPKPGPLATTKPVGAAASKATRTAAGVSASRTSKLTATTTKAAAAVKTAVSKSAAAPPTGRTAAAQPPKAAAAKKDVGRPPAAPAVKKPAGATASPAARKQEASKPAAASKASAVPKETAAATKAVDNKSKPPPPAKLNAAKKPAAAGRLPAVKKPLPSQTPPASPANKPAKSSTPKTKGGARPVQTVAPFSSTKRSRVPGAAAAAAAAAAPEAPSASASAAEDPPAGAAAEAPSAQEPPQTASSSEEAPTLQSATPASPTPEQSASAATATPPDKAPPMSSCPHPTPGAITQAPPAANLNEEEEEEEKEGSQLVSVSEMSGTTQPTEESRPDSAGPVGASAWRAGGALLSELDSEDVSGSQQGASELSAPGVLEGTESTDDLGDGSLKGAMDMEGASAGSPDFEKVPDIPVIDFDEDEDDSDRVCDMDVGSEKTDEPRRPRHDNDMDEEEEDDEDVEMASEGVTESGLESYGNADEDDFAEDERLDNLNREAPPPPPLLPSAPAAQWDQPNPFADPWAEPFQTKQAVQPAAEPLLGDCVAPPPTAIQAWPDAASFVPEKQNSPQRPSAEAPEKSQSGNLNSESGTPEDDISRDGKLRPPGGQANADRGADVEEGEKETEEEEEEPEPETLPADEVLGGPATAPTSAPSSSTTTEDEASDTEGEAQLEDSLVASAVMKMKFDGQPLAQRCLSTVEEGVEEEGAVAPAAAEDTTSPSAASLASYGFDSATTPSNSNAQSTGESCVRSPGIFSLEELSEEAKEPPTEQQYMECRKQDGDAAEVSGGGPHPPSSLENPAENVQPLYYSICEKTEDSLAALHPQWRDHAPLSRTYYDVVKLPGAAGVPPKLTCADLPPRSPGGRGASPQLRRLEQHQRQLLELQHRREQQSRPLEEAEQERKRRVEEEERRKKEEAEEEIKRNKRAAAEEETKQRRELELQLQQQQQELQQRQQILQWQQELQEASKGQAVLLSPSGLCTIYEALESSEEEEDEELDNEEHPESPIGDRTRPDEDKRCSSPSAGSPSPPHCTLSSSNPSREEEMSSLCPPESPEHPSALDLDWGQKVDIVQQLINQTLLLNGDGCSSLLLLPGGAGGTLSPLESSLWPSLLPPLTPPSATVTSVSSFSPDATGSSAQGEWTVVELETHH
ncbi:nascent polypeptide-associated complex subunit alpha, muscle-specific form [Oryzias latipes]|uniref:BTB/POZ domain-containing protein n=1 Tax=Oryzias latipes TaxID=8090 RepID=A0A3B3IKG9_ORYLA|nr:nascent polypeptide-associated complex subunit alpha, muscle-specific form [Oryzias latipes]XP_023809857.1 nascent polypeptide-associated complex subunit alpha, muscle-specific form [Oryzias latipes]